MLVHSCPRAPCESPRSHLSPTAVQRWSKTSTPRGHAFKCKTATQPYTWTGSDEFDQLGDRKDAAPLPLPNISEPKRITLVRHGQSTWNATGIIQGSSDVSVLTTKGVKQAETARDMLQLEIFQHMFHSPLARAAKTASIIWQGRRAPVTVLPSLREVDLYSFQGLVKSEGKARYGDQYKAWKDNPANFVIDGHAPVRELWYRASVAWQEILATKRGVSNTLVVAHNAVNQALIATALGLPPLCFRRILQSNAAASTLQFSPAAAGSRRAAEPPVPKAPKAAPATEQSPGRPFRPDVDGSDAAPLGRLLLVCGPGGLSTTLAPQGTPELLRELQVDKIVSSDLPGDRAEAALIAARQLRETLTECWPQLGKLDLLHPEMAWEALRESWQQLAELAAGGQTAVVVCQETVVDSLLMHGLGLASPRLQFRPELGSVSIVEFPDGASAAEGVVRCVGYSAHHDGDYAPQQVEGVDGEF